ncbi:MAG: hypothetical protein WAK10_08650, partial [Methanoregula sp.]
GKFMVFHSNPVARWFDDYRHILTEFEPKKLWLFKTGLGGVNEKIPFPENSKAGFEGPPGFHLSERIGQAAGNVHSELPPKGQYS